MYNSYSWLIRGCGDVLPSAILPYAGPLVNQALGKLVFLPVLGPDASLNDENARDAHEVRVVAGGYSDSYRGNREA